MTIIGLTGGIAAGKSTAAEILREFGATVIDADRLGHRSYEPGTPGFQKVVNAFGHDIVAKDGTIDRRVLGGKVFGAPGELERLNKIVWPEIRHLIKDEVKQIRQQEENPIIVLEAAVLLEAGWEDLCDEIWVVVTPVKTAVERLKERNNLTEDAAMARIEAQMSNKERTDRADVKIENASTEEQLRARVERAWKALETRHARKTGTKAGAGKGTGKAQKTGSVKAASAPAKTTTRRAASTAAPKKAPAKAGSGKAAAAKPAASKAAKPAAKPSGKTAAKATAKAAPRTTAKASKASTKATPKAAAKTTKASASKPTTRKPSSPKAATQKAANARTK